MNWSLFRSLALPVYLPTFLFGIGQGAVIPILAIAALDRGADLPTAGAIVALRGIASMVASVPVSRMVSRLGEMNAVFVGAAVMVAALTTAILSAEVWVYAMSVFALGCSWSVWMLTRLTFVTATVAPGERGRALSTLGGVVRIGNTVGPFLSAALLGLVPGVPFVVHLVAGLAAAAVFVLADHRLTRSGGERTDSEPAAILSVVRANGGVLVRVGASVFVLSALRGARDVLLPLAGTALGMDAATVSIAYGLALAMETAVFLVGGTVADRWGRRWVAAPCLLGMSVCLAVLALVPDAAWFLIAAALSGLVNGYGSGIVMTLGTDFAPRRGGTEFLGLWRLLSEAGTATGPVMLAGLAALAGLAPAALVLAGFGAAASVYHWLAVPESRNSD